MVHLSLPDLTIIDTGPGPSRLRDLLIENSINPYEVILTKNSEIVPDDLEVAGEDCIRVIDVVHGG